MKRRIRQNVWGNWKGYEGNRKVACFGIDEQEAKAWLAGGELERGFDLQARGFKTVGGPVPRFIKL